MSCRCPGQFVQGVVALVVLGLVVAGQLDHDVVAAEGVAELSEFFTGRPGAPGGERRADRALAAAGEDHPVPAVVSGELLQVVDGAGLLAAGELGDADGPAQPPVPIRIPGQHEQMPAPGVGSAGPLDPGTARFPGGPFRADAQLGAEDRAERDARLLGELGGRLGELGHPVHAVVIGDGQRFEAEPGRLGHQLGGAGGAVEEAV